jgi:quercetin dioxygenase-like cupin family protein
LYVTVDTLRGAPSRRPRCETILAFAARRGDGVNNGATKYRWDDMPKEELKPDLHRRLVSTDRMMLAHVYLDKGCIVPQHSHENEQLTYILEGTLRFFLGEDESEVVDVAAGEVLHLPSWLPHKAEALDDVLDVDIFCPPRQDWLDGSDAYLRNT